MGLVLVLTVVDPASFTEVFFAGWFFGVSMLFVLLVGFPTVFLASFPDVLFTVWFCTEWFHGNFPNVLIAVLYTDLFNVIHVEPASVLHGELMWA